MKLIRQKFNDAFHDKLPISINKIVAGKDIYFFNAYSDITESNEQVQFEMMQML